MTRLGQRESGAEVRDDLRRFRHDDMNMREDRQGPPPELTLETKMEPSWATSDWPELNEGCPQQVCAARNSTSWPRRFNTVAAAKPT